MSGLGRLGSFEGYGVSAGNLGFGASDGFGAFGGLSEKDQRQIRELQADLKLAAKIKGQSQAMNQPHIFTSPRRDWQYFVFRGGSGKSPHEVETRAHMEISMIHKRSGSSSGSSGGSGPGAGEVLTGIAAILAPLTKAGVGIYAAHQQSQGGAPQPQYQQQSYQEPQKSNTGLIIGIAVVLLLVGGFIMMSGNKQAQAPMYGPVHRPGGYKKRNKKRKNRKKSRKRR